MRRATPLSRRRKQQRKVEIKVIVYFILKPTLSSLAPSIIPHVRYRREHRGGVPVSEKVSCFSRRELAKAAHFLVFAGFQVISLTFLVFLTTTFFYVTFLGREKVNVTLNFLTTG